MMPMIRLGKSLPSSNRWRRPRGCKSRLSMIAAWRGWQGTNQQTLEGLGHWTNDVIRAVLGLPGLILLRISVYHCRTARDKMSNLSTHTCIPPEPWFRDILRIYATRNPHQNAKMIKIAHLKPYSNRALNWQARVVCKSSTLQGRDGHPTFQYLGLIYV